jgi:hypothetical protein
MFSFQELQQYSYEHYQPNYLPLQMWNISID